MKIQSKVLSTLLASMTITSSVFAAPAPEVGSVDRALYNRERVYTDFQAVTRELQDVRKQEALKIWARAVTVKDPTYLKVAYSLLKDKIQNRALIQLIAHDFYTKQPEKARSAVEYYYHAAASWMFEVAGNPLLTSEKQEAAKLYPAAAKAVDGLRACLANASSVRDVSEKCITPEVSMITDFARRLLNDKYYSGPSSLVGYEGFIGGNRVELITQNRTNAAFVNYLAPITQKIHSGVSTLTKKAYSEMSVADFKAALKDRKDVSKLFTKEEGFPTNLDDVASPDFHQLFTPTVPESGEKNIYGELYRAISGAKETVFYDVYFFGGSPGSFLAKKLIDMVQKNPSLHVYISTDRWNTMSYTKELTVAFNFLRAYSENFPQDRIVILPPNIFLKRTSLPSFFDLLVNDEMMKNITEVDFIKQKLSVYPKAKSDHSKVLVVDGKNPATGLAFVGSKNLTDSSGAVAYDEVAKLQGPIVPVIQDSYYWDLTFALELEHDGASKGFAGYTAENKAYVDSLYGAGAESQPTRAKIQKILAPLDVLGRTNAGYMDKIKVATKAAGSTTLQIAQNNIFGTIRTPALQDIQLILSAKRQIIIQDQFLYDADIVNALIKAVQKNTQLRIYIMISSLSDLSSAGKPFAHVPNIIFVNDLKSQSRIQVKWAKTPRAFEDSLLAAKAKHSIELAPEFHLKGISIDGVTEDKQALCAGYSNESKIVASDVKSAIQAITDLPVLVSGSANKDNLTMMGGFREFQIGIFNDKEASAKHDCLFWNRWNNPDRSTDINLSMLNVPASLKAKGVTEEMFLATLKRLLTSAYNFKMD